MFNRVVLLFVCIILLFVAWTAVLNMQHPIDKQAALIALANEEIERGTYIKALPYLLDAVSYNTEETLEATETLKRVYLELGYTQEYASVLKSQTARADCPAPVYEEYARYFILEDRLRDALKTITLGIERTQAESLVGFYEEHRYAFTIGHTAFDDVTAYHNGGIQVKKGDLWGLANAAGGIIIPCMYEQISTYDPANGGSIIVMHVDKKISTVNMSNQITATSNIIAEQVGTLSQDIVSLQLSNGQWILADSNLNSNFSEYEGVGASHNSAIALKSSGKWGVAGLGSGTIVPYEFDEVIMDELGRSYALGAVFAKKDDVVYLFVNGEQQPETYEDARPFTEEGWAAVKKNGKWGFIDITGAERISFIFDDARSFGQHLAAVRVGDLWGYTNWRGIVVIEPVFLDAKSFSGGRAPVLTDLGWQFITLVEFS